MISSLLQAGKLLARNPSEFMRVLQVKLLRTQTLRKLRRALRQNGQGVIYARSGELLLPFHDDGDMQELLYHACGQQWYEAECAILSRYLKPGHTVVDVGANIGFITGIASRMVGEQGTVHSFEPSPAVHAKLLGVIRENGLSNVITHNVGCGDVPGEMMLASPTGSSGNATLTNPAAATGPLQKVRIVCLDDYLTVLERLDFIKIDTEGFEDHVLAGAGALMDAYHPTVYIELSSEYRQSSERAIQWLRDHGYIFEIEPDLSCAHNGDNFIAIHSSRVPLPSLV